MYTCLIRDDTDEAVNAAFAEKHVPRFLEVQQNSYAFSVPGANDFTSFEFVIENVGPGTLDSVYVGFLADLDCGPISLDRYFADDLAEPRAPQGPDPTIDLDPTDPENPNAPYLETILPNDPRFQTGLCTADTVHVSGFSLVDDEGDLGQTQSASSFLLLGHTTDPTGARAPRRVGFRMYYWYPPGTPFSQGGAPANDLERYEAISSTRGIDPATGLINSLPPLPGDTQDYRAIASVGPFLEMKSGEKITVAVALAAQQIDYAVPIDDIAGRFPLVVENAVSAVKTYRGTYEVRPELPSPEDDGFGQETALIAEPGQEFRFSDCHDDSSGSARTVRDDAFTWFDLDCNYCTGVAGHVLKRWVASSPPPNPELETVPQDRSIRLRWDNLSEYTLDPAKGIFDFKGYKIWKAANWTRPTGSTGPGDDLWALVGTYFWYDELDPLIEHIVDPGTGDTSIVTTENVLLNRLTGEKIFPQPVPCLGGEDGMCLVTVGDKPTVASNGGDSTITNYEVTKYPIGRYEWDDESVINGFLYFYAVTAFDSTGKGSAVAKLEGRPAATEGDGELPQGSLADAGMNDGNVFVVPNPYRGRAEWDLNPSAGDPTGTHIDFYNMPPGPWTMRIYTIAGDLVQEIRSSDLQLNGKPQQETPDDGQASWNLITRNGQEIVSGIYMFSVEAAGDRQQGKFVVIR